MTRMLASVATLQEARLAAECGVDIIDLKNPAAGALGALPLDMSIREQADAGFPIVSALPDSQSAAIYRDIARKAAARLALKARDYSARFPTITVAND